MSGISFTGLGSGMPVKDIVNAFVNAERVPFQQRMNKQGAKLTTNISANGALKSALDSLASSLEKLKDIEKFQLRKTSGSDDFISLSSDKTAQVGSYDVKVNQLAQAHKAMTNTSFEKDAKIGTGTLSFATAKDAVAGKNGFNIEVSDTDTLSDIRDKINKATDNDDVIATIITEDNGKQRLVMTAKETGKDNQIFVTATQADGTDSVNDLSKIGSATVVDLTNIAALDSVDELATISPPISSNLQQLKSANDASITIDGVITITNATNEFKGAIDGVDITATKAHGVDDDVSNASVSEDNSMVSRELGNFVKAYNEYYELAKTLGKAKTNESESNGAMVGDSMLRGVTYKLRTMLSRPFNSEGSNSLSLSQLGVESDQYGKLTFDASELKETLSKNPGAIQQFFIGTEDKPGFAASLHSVLDSYTKKDGLIATRIEGYQTQLERLDDDMISFDSKMKKYEARLLSQYNAMDLLVAQMTSTSSYMMAQLSNMPGVVRKTK
ncbi:MAG: flagellar filament capping protein FliD [Gammaproteobacteria bacterium]|nr:flagellar filament capping protein FliD [Gammaproteobacteria bacterium]